jgi:Zn-finger nucleic acid-binding protein
MVLHGCGRCGGIFVDIDGSKRLATAFPMAAADLSDKAAVAAATTPDLLARIACPVCRKPMTRTRLPKTTLDIDICDDGTWFDRDELRRAAEALHPVKKAPARGGAVGAPAHANVYQQGIENLLGIADHLLDLNDNPRVLAAKIARLERDLGQR